MVGTICSIFVFEDLFYQMFHIREQSMRKNIYDGVIYDTLEKLKACIVQSAILLFHHRNFLKQVPKICCVEKNIFTKKSMVYLSFNKKVTILPKRKLMLDFAEKPPW